MTSGLRLGQAGQDEQVDAVHPVLDPHPPLERQRPAQPQFDDQRGAFGGIFGVFVLRPQHDEADVGPRGVNDGGGADIGLHVLDRHHPTEQRDDGPHRVARIGQVGEAADIDAVGDRPHRRRRAAAARCTALFSP